MKERTSEHLYDASDLETTSNPELPDATRWSLTRREMILGGSALLLGLMGLTGFKTGSGGSLARAAANSDSLFPNYFRWDAPIFPDVRPRFTLKLGHQGTPNVFVSGEHTQSVVFKNVVERATQGLVQVQVYPAGSLGSAQEQLEQTRNGIIQACIQESAVPTLYKPIQVFSIPYIFRSHSVAWAVYDGPFGREFFAEMADQVGLSVVGVGENGGFRSLTNNRRPIRHPDDLKGLKIRTQEHEGQIAMFRAMGAAPTPIPWVELYTALQTGVVDGQENAVPTINLGKLQEVQDYLTLDNHIYGAHYLLVNTGWLNRLPQEFQEIIRDAGRQAAVASRGMNRTLEWELLARLANDFKEIYVPSAEEMKAFQEAAQPAYLDWYHKNVDPQGKWSSKLFEAVKAAEQSIFA